MFGVEHMCLSPVEVNKQTGNHSSQEKNMSKLVQQIDAKDLDSEKLAEIPLVSSDGLKSEPGEINASVTRIVSNENGQPTSGDLTRNPFSEHLGSTSESMNNDDKTSKSSCLVSESTQPVELKQQLGFKVKQPEQITTTVCIVNEAFSESLTGAECVHDGLLEPKHHQDSELVQNVTAESNCVLSTCINIEQLESAPVANRISFAETPKPLIEPSSPGVLTINCGIEQAALLAKTPVKNSKCWKKKHLIRSSIANDRVLRSKSQEKPKDLKSEEKPKEPEPANTMADITPQPSGGEKRKKKKKPIVKNNADEFSRIRKHLRYFINRINYEESLISAYSAEGWKGLSLEKLKPEKELQRAKSEILRRKLKIRDLFQHLDSLCAQGRLPESLFDSEGEISSEDIFCAKCGLADLSVDNDIILCDGACDRGFHQYCLQPPLLKEDIPPGDESWLCPGCDCKFDCIDLLNDSLETNLTIKEGWEKVFPKEAAAASGDKQDPNLGLPSDDSDDDDYDPDRPETKKKDQSGESSSDESSSDGSSFSCASDELKTPSNNDQNMGLSSDSEDDDYNPNAPDNDQEVKHESSSSDFSSDSEDLGVSLECKGYSLDLPRDSKARSSTLNGSNGLSVNDELSLLDSDPCQNVSQNFVKRSIERLDYKTLYDEAYGNVPSSSSDDENWTDVASPRQKRKVANGRSPKGLNQKAKKLETSDYMGTSSNLVAPLDNNNQYMGLPSDDSEDDDYNPNAVDIGQDVKQVSSSSDYESESEDLGAVLEENGSSFNLLGGSTEISSKLNGSKLQSENNENGSAAPSVKRSTERLNYKKLYDETYGNVPSSSSDDENWNDAASPRQKRKKANGSSPKGLNLKTKNIECTPKLKTPQKSKFDDQKTPSVKTQEGSSSKQAMPSDKMHEGSSSKRAVPSDMTPEGSSKRAMTSDSRRLGDTVTQGLQASFKENQYPNKAKKESLATELGITYRQVNKWFDNTRWSYNHPSSKSASTPNNAPNENPTPQSGRKPKVVLKDKTALPKPDNKPLELTPKTITKENGPPEATPAATLSPKEDSKDVKPISEENSKGKSTTKSRKRKNDVKPEEQTLDSKSKNPKKPRLAQNSRKTQKGKPVAKKNANKLNAKTAQKTQSGGRKQTRRRK